MSRCKVLYSMENYLVNAFTYRQIVIVLPVISIALSMYLCCYLNQNKIYKYAYKTHIMISDWH